MEMQDAFFYAAIRKMRLKQVKPMSKRDTKSLVLPAILAAGGGLAMAPAQALELGEIQVQSTLGQPLRASIAYALGPNEQLSAYCVSLQQARQSNGIPAISNADISVANGVITLAGRNLVREPLNTLRIDIRCPYAAKFSREYMLFVDPADVQQATPVTTAPAATADIAAAVPARPAPAPRAVRPVANSAPIPAMAQYRVQPGDSLSEIAQRIENRQVGLWSAVAQIHAANPQAFINNDPNQLKAGALLAIPQFGENARFVEATPAPAATAPATLAESTGNAVDAVVPVPDSNVANTSTAELETAPPVTSAQAVETDAAAAATQEPVLVSDLADVELPVPGVASSPNAPVATIVAPTANPANTSNSWLWLLVGGGVALLGALLIFGRKIRRTDVPAPVEPAQTHPMRRRSDTAKLETIVDENYNLEDDAPTSENLSLDADLMVGTDLDGGADMAIAGDFDFTSSAELDLEFPAEAEYAEGDAGTDIIAPPQVESSSILEREVLPDDDDYDMSVIMDVTKVPLPDEVTERDLKAVVVEGEDDTQIADSYTVNQEIDYQVLEQDYEDELTATQALNLEIEKAAAELSNRINADAAEDENDGTARLPLATVTSIDTTSRLQVTDEEDTGVLEELNVDDTVNEEPTSKLRAVTDDDTVEMANRSGKVDSKAG